MKYNPDPKMPKVERLAKPEHKQEYEMPEYYHEYAEKLVELIEARDKFAKDLRAMSFEEYARAKPMFDQLDAGVEELEEKMSYEYERYQEEQRREQELEEVTWGQDLISEELFIRVKHQRSHIFEKFLEYASQGMTEAEREEQYAIIAKREAEELNDILSGKIEATEYDNLYIKHRLPDEWIAELLLQIIEIAYRTDVYFSHSFEALERLAETNREFGFHVSDALPVRRRNMEEAIYDNKKILGRGRRFLLDYAREAIKSGKFKLLKSGYTGYLDDHLEMIEMLVFLKYVVIKHTIPERIEEYVRIVTEGFSKKETDVFMERAAECEEKNLRGLMQSLEYERIAWERVETRRAASDYKKIEGPDLPDRVKRSMAENYERRQKKAIETPPDPIDQKIPEIVDYNLKVLLAVTDGGGYTPERYEDEQSRKDDEMTRLLDEASKNHDKLYIIIKHQMPEKFEEFRQISVDCLSPDELKEFEERIAHLEDTQLEEILAGK